MIIEVRSRSQITIPSEIIKSMGINEGDKFEIIEKDGGIFMCPVIICSKEKLDKLAKKIKKIEKEKKSTGFKNVDKMFKDIGINMN